ncbi:NAD-dependent succinate-semialdehyde dehydrogenase [Neolewinella antarctica]|uniref:Succinate-semialdehyde dehydrogenase/glutarate-semialdehyde dehydrogenase n=1 Tax=Neolewinella antarctica TaxID=442734 RepID=A0ABX0X673_9BACT|nr:NAD-dependent succinate-semialdehyde dehydrogenase [Neolewinella antarctica]NJC24700.1 succinate-semialdehyde dehydrogenase/glutarate-semialdehyde dehydrogenase [Neolewinella antarctica]
MTRSHDKNPPNLVFTEALIGNEWCPASSGKKFAVTDPASGKVLAEVADCGPQEAERAIDSAASALPEWKLQTARERANLLQNWYKLIVEHKEALAQLMTAEQGKPLAESRSEVDYGASFVRWFAEEANRTDGDIIPATNKEQRIIVIREPIGVVAAITPWNFPIAMITRKVAPALAAGCTVVVKPSEDTPLCALALGALAIEAGFPEGVLNILPSNQAKEVGEILTTHKTVKKLSFTGSTAVGKLLMKQCAGTVKKMSLELGGNAPFIVFGDADVEGAVAGAMISKFRNAGQTCICANRIYVHTNVYDEFLAKLIVRVIALITGPGAGEGVTIGPLINASAVAKVKRLVDQAIGKGAVLTYQAELTHSTDRYYPPTILTEVDESMDIAQEEIFGPVATIFKFTSEEEVIQRANDTAAGLAAYFYAKDAAQIWRVAEALEYGMVGINTGAISTPVAPFGGIKESGFGREGGKYGIDEYLTTKYLNWQI